MMLRKLLISILSFSILACSAGRAPIPAGEIPRQGELSSEDEQYGHEVLSTLTDQYPLSYDDAPINRVREIVDRLTAAAGADFNPWHPYVLKGDVKNAAATRGNVVVIWTGMLDVVHSDDELATILAHEISHVLAGHTQPTPAEETNEILSGIVGTAAGQATAMSGYAGLADLAAQLVSASIKAMIVNPESQRKELEADQIGLFLMADAGYNPEDGVHFWERVEGDPDFRGPGIPFLSSHPPTEERAKRLNEILPEALARYNARSQKKTKGAVQVSRKVQEPKPKPPRSNREIWILEDEDVDVYEEPDTRSHLVTTLRRGDRVTVIDKIGPWLEIDRPEAGFIREENGSPEIQHRTARR